MKFLKYLLGGGIMTLPIWIMLFCLGGIKAVFCGFIGLCSILLFFGCVTLGVAIMPD